VLVGEYTLLAKVPCIVQFSFSKVIANPAMSQSYPPEPEVDTTNRMRQDLHDPACSQTGGLQAVPESGTE
jgi:hypothetical protein